MIEEFKNKYLKSGIILDSNILLLLVVGRINPKLIKDNNCLSKYNEEMFSELNAFISIFKKIIVTPHILTELSNLYFSSMHKASDLSKCEKLLRILKDLYEIQIMKDNIINEKSFCKYGITDIAIVNAAKRNKIGILTDDYKLSGYATFLRLGVININHILY